ncbi:AAA family ATPase [Oceanispirochaeta sp. M1]|nr:AAA family ATPase [Oceanispirochaeta sp. M1]
MELYRYLFINKSKIQELCDTFTMITGIGVALVDLKLIRIVATGRCNVNQFLNINGLIQKKVITQNTKIVIQNPKVDPECKSCVQKAFCKETLEVCMPVNLLEQPIGAMSFITFTKKDRTKILQNLEMYQELIDNFILLIENFLKKRLDRNALRKNEPVYRHKKITFENLIGNAQSYLHVIQKAKMVAPNDVSVMISGESGTGKEMLANAIHNASNRRDNSFVAINCGAIPENLIESELFGYVKGAFTGANNQGRIGKFEMANKGTIFLDEITEMPIYLQTKLLRVLQEQNIERLGSNTLVDLDVRVIAATNKDIKSMINEGIFRADLFYRLNVIPLDLPPLRERYDDIVPLMNYFMTKHSSFISNRMVQDFKVKKNVFEFLKGYTWPGNIRELENVIIHMLNMMDDEGNVTLESLPVYMLDENMNFQCFAFSTIENLEKNAIIKAMDFYGEDTEGKNAAAESLGIGLTTLYRKMKKYNLCLDT